MSFATLSIDGDGPLSQDLRVSLDGHELRGLRSLRLDLAINEANQVDLAIEVGKVHVSAKALAILQAHVLTEPTEGE